MTSKTMPCSASSTLNLSLIHISGEVLNSYEALPIWPASHYVTARPKMDKALGTIQDELRAVSYTHL